MLDGQLDEDMRELCQEEFTQAKKDLEQLEEELKILLLPRDPNDDKDVIVEIRGGVGGEESALFAHSLFRMYSMYADRRGWKVSLLNYNETELGGVKEADFVISGDGAYSRLKFESGVHRVQRGSRRPSPADGSIPPRPPWRCCRKWRPWTWICAPRISKCRCSAPAAPAASISTRPLRRSG